MCNMDVIFWLVKIQNLNKTVRKKNYLVKNKFVLTLGETSPHLHKIDFFFFILIELKKKKIKIKMISSSKFNLEKNQ